MNFTDTVAPLLHATICYKIFNHGLLSHYSVGALSFNLSWICKGSWERIKDKRMTYVPARMAFTGNVFQIGFKDKTKPDTN